MIAHRPVLYAEDDENDAFLMQRAFQKAGIRHPLQIVPSGTSAIDYLSGAGPFMDRGKFPTPQLVILDLKLAGESGFDVLKWIRVQPAIASLPVIVLTSSNQDKDMQQAYLLGANGFLMKPGKPDDLLAMAKGINDFWLMQNRSLPI